MAIANDKQESDYYLSGWEDDLNSDEIQELHLEEDDTGLTNSAKYHDPANIQGQRNRTDFCHV